MCGACGLVAHKQISQELEEVCQGKPTNHYRRTNKRFLARLKPPINFSEFPEADKNSIPLNHLIPVLSKRNAKQVIKASEKPDQGTASESD